MCIPKTKSVYPVLVWIHPISRSGPCSLPAPQEMSNPTGAVGRCGKLKPIGVTTLGHGEDMISVAYTNNERGVHAIKNCTGLPAITLHVYAPGLRKMRLFKGQGEVLRSFPLCTFPSGHM